MQDLLSRGHSDLPPSKPAMGSTAADPDAAAAHCRQPCAGCSSQWWHGNPARSEPTASAMKTGGGVSKTSQKDKTRLAQRMWRQKQKERLEQATEQVATLQQQVQELSLAQGAMMRRNAALEQALTAHAARSSPPDAAATPAAATAVQDAAAAVAAASAMPAAPPAVAAAATTVQHETDADRGTACQLAWWQDCEAQAHLAEELGVVGELVFTVRREAPLFMTRHQVAGMGDQEFGRLWRQYVDAMAACLLLLRTEGERGSAADRLHRLVAEAQQLEMCVLLDQPDFTALQLRQPDAGAVAAVVETCRRPAAFWRQLMESTGLSAGQEARLLRLRERYISSCASLARARSTHEGKLPAEDNPVAFQLGDSCIMSLAFERLQAAIEGIGDVLRQEQELFLRTTAAMWAVLTPAQYAHLTVSTPAHTSVLCGAETLAVATGQAPFAAALHSLSSCGDAAPCTLDI